MIDFGVRRFGRDPIPKRRMQMIVIWIFWLTSTCRTIPSHYVQKHRIWNEENVLHHNALFIKSTMFRVGGVLNEFY